MEKNHLKFILVNNKLKSKQKYFKHTSNLNMLQVKRAWLQSSCV